MSNAIETNTLVDLGLSFEAASAISDLTREEGYDQSTTGGLAFAGKAMLGGMLGIAFSIIKLAQAVERYNEIQTAVR